MKKLILLLLLIPSLAWGQVSTSGVSLSGCSSGGASAAADGPNAWYFSCTETPASEPSWVGNGLLSDTIAKCAPVTVPTGGTATKLSIKAGEAFDEHAKLGLYDTSGNRLAYCTNETGAFAGDNVWMDCDLSANYTIASGNYYICSMSNLNGAYTKRLETDGKSQGSLEYASFPYATLTLETLSGNCFGMRVFVD